MSFDTQRLFELLPAIYRLRDLELASQTANLLTPAEAAELGVLEASPGPLGPRDQRRLRELRAQRDRGPLAALLGVLATQLALLEDNLDELYDNEFVETATPWALPYLGELIGYRSIHDTLPALSRRAEIAHTIAFRRRKGTASMLEQLARDVTGFNARAVEYFSRLATTQSLNHRRLDNRVAPSLRDGAALEWVGGAFDEMPRTLDVRRINTGAGRYNIPNIGIFLWRLDALRLTGTPAVADPADATGRRFRFSPLGIDAALVGRPVGEEDISRLATPVNVPARLSRRRLADGLPGFYGPDASLSVELDGIPVSASGVRVCNLADAHGGWAHESADGRVAIDPVLGRLTAPTDRPAPAIVTVMFHTEGIPTAFGGEYSRRVTFRTDDTVTARVPGTHASIQAALDSLAGIGTVEITDSGRYEEVLSIDAAAGGTIEVRAADGHRPTLVLSAPLRIRGDTGSRVALNGLLILGAGIEVAEEGGPQGNDLAALDLAHCTLVPGYTLAPDGTPADPGAPSVRLASADTVLGIDRCITGPLRLAERAAATVSDSIIDAGASTAAAVAAEGGGRPGALTLESVTVIGEVQAGILSASNSILLGAAEVERRQEGCLRFSFAPLATVGPRRYRCQPAVAANTVDVPHFASLRFGSPQYARLADSTPASIRRGAEDESEMGAFHWRYEPQRTSDLLTRFDEYLRVGLAAGIFHES